MAYTAGFFLTFAGGFVSSWVGGLYYRKRAEFVTHIVTASGLLIAGLGLVFGG